MTAYTKRYLSFRGLGKGDGLHAQDLSNLYCKQDGLHKRNGFVEEARFGAPIDGLHSVRMDKQRYLLVYSGCRFYVRKAGESSFADVTQTGGDYAVDTSMLRPRRTHVFEHDGKVYIVGCGDYLVLGIWDARLQLRRVLDGEDTYVPTTRVGIGCKDNVTYVPTTVDNYTVGEFFYKQGDDYVAVELDGDESIPVEGVEYYRRIVYPTAGNEQDEPNMLSTYRYNTLYGTPSSDSLYTLDAGKVDSDSATTVEVDVLENEQQAHYTLVPSLGAVETRAPVVGDDLSGVTLQFSSQLVSGMGSLHSQPSAQGNVIVTATGGYIGWQSTGPTDADWYYADLVVCSGQEQTVIATAMRTGFSGKYTVSWRTCSVLLPATFGTLTHIKIVHGGIPWSASLPTLVSPLVCGQTVWGSIDYRAGTLHFTKATTPPTLTDNIRVLYKARVEGLEAIQSASVATAFGVGGNADRLFVGGSDVAPNADYHSQSGDWTYFAPSSVQVLGETGQIKAYLHRGESLVTLLIQVECPNAYWRAGEWVSSEVALGDSVYTLRTAQFVVFRTATLPSCATDEGVGSLKADDVYLAKDGLYRVYSTAYNDQKAQLLSAPLDGIVWDETSLGIVYDQRYYLSNGSAVYVGDSRYLYSLHNTQNYEWFRWDIKGVTAWVADDRLGFGTQEGSVCFFTSGYIDEYRWQSAAGQLGVSSGTQIYYDAALEVEEGDLVRLMQEGYYHVVDGYDVGDTKVYVSADDVLRVYEGEQWYLVQDEVLSGPYTVADVDWGACSFSLVQNGQPVSFSSLPTAILARLDERPLYVVDKTEQTFGLATQKGGTPRTIYSATPLSTALFTRKLPVCAYYQSEVLSMGSPDVDKLLVGVTLGGVSAQGTGGVTLSVRTSEQGRTMAVGGLHAMDFANLQLDAFSFDGSFERAFRARCKLRFHYLQWRVAATQDQDFALDGVFLHYKLLHNAKGVLE